MLRRAVILSHLLRGAKKGKGKEDVKIEATTDIINIYKDKSDPELLPKDQYPAWLFPMVYQFEEHPSEIGERMYRGEKLKLTFREQRRLFKWAKRTKIIEKNHTNVPKFIRDPRKLDYLDMDMPGGEDSDWDPEDIIGPMFKLSLGAPYKAIMEENLQKVREELGIIPLKSEQGK